MNVGDILWFYATSPVAGIIGIGIVKDKYIDKVNLVWPEEWKKKEVIWPLRFRIQVLKVLPQSKWKTHKIKIDDFKLVWQIGFQLLKDVYATELFNRAKIMFGLVEEKDIYSGATITQPQLIYEEKPALLTLEEGKLITTHRDLQNQIAEIGKLQFYYTEVEYPIELSSEKRSLDVVWKREIDGVPTFAFEIELSGMVEKAIDRLKFAFKKWNSRPRIIIPEKFVKKVYNIVSISEKDFSNIIKIYTPSQIAELWKKKHELKTLEKSLEMY